MAGPVKREPLRLEPFDMFTRLDRIFDGWMTMVPFRTPVFGWDWMPDDVIPVNQYRDDETLVLRAELPGIDPDKDLELTVSDGMLRIDAERRAETTTDDTGYRRRELRFGSISRTLPIPEGVSDTDITADYRDGILEIRIVVPEPIPDTKVPITKR